MQSDERPTPAPSGDELRAIYEQVNHALTEACKRGKLLMCIPAQPSDEDILIADYIRVGPPLADALDRLVELEGENERLRDLERRVRDMPEFGGKKPGSLSRAAVLGALSSLERTAQEGDQ